MISYLAVDGLEPLSDVAAHPDRWERLRARLQSLPFLHSEGVSADLGTPVRASAELTRRAQELVTRFDGFSSALVKAYYERPEVAREFLVNPLLEPLIALDRGVPIPIPSSRFDCVMDAAGELQVIEHNAVGVCLYHFRNLLYLIRGMSRAGLENDARELDRFTLELSRGFRRYYESLCPEPRDVPVIGGLHPSGWLRAGQLMFRAGFERHGWRYVSGGPEHVTVDEHGISIRGVRVDLLWSDFLFYIAYQAERYQETRFPSKQADFSDTPNAVRSLMHDETFLRHLRERRVINIGPGAAYLALPKPILSWVHRDDAPIDVPEIAWLRRHTARTYATYERCTLQLLTPEEVVRDKARYVIKPALYGGSHGVYLGCEVARDDWAKHIERIWTDETWAIQEFITPARTADGDWVSYGLMNYGGQFGGFLLRSSKSLAVNARESAFIPAAFPR